MCHSESRRLNEFLGECCDYVLSGRDVTFGVCKADKVPALECLK